MYLSSDIFTTFINVKASLSIHWTHIYIPLLILWTCYLIIANHISTRKSIAGRVWRVYPLSWAVRVRRLHPPSERFDVGGSRLCALLWSKACGCHGDHRIHREMLGHTFCISSWWYLLRDDRKRVNTRTIMTIRISHNLLFYQHIVPDVKRGEQRPRAVFLPPSTVSGHPPPPQITSGTL